MADILFVCEANLCRSPFAELVLKSLLKNRSQQRLRVRSAGTAARKGTPIDAQMADFVRAFGGDPTQHRSRSVRALDVAGATLVLTSTRSQRGAIVTLHPPAIQYTHTIRQFGRVLDAAAAQVAELGSRNRASGDQVDALNALFKSSRHLSPPDLGEADDVVDPIARDPAVYQAAVRQIIPALNHLATALDLESLTGPEPSAVSTQRQRAALAFWRRRPVVKD